MQENMNSNLCLNCMRPIQSERFCPHCGYDQNCYKPSELFLLPGTELFRGQYLIGRVLGHGGFGITYLARDINLDTIVAIKEYLPNGFAYRTSGDTQVRYYGEERKELFEYGIEKFLEEARALARFQRYPGVVSVFNFFKENGTAYFVMEYIEGMTVKQYLQQAGGYLPWNTAVQLVMPVVETLKVVHEAGVIHRDISPDNIFLCDDGLIKVLDFGAARQAMGEQSQSLSVILKQGYAPFEQYSSSGKQGPWTDVYATAATLYKMVTGSVPPEATERIRDDSLRSAQLFKQNVPDKAQKLMLKALAVQPEKRLRNMEEFGNGLQATVDHTEKANEPGLLATVPLQGLQMTLNLEESVLQSPYFQAVQQVAGLYGQKAGSQVTVLAQQVFQEGKSLIAERSEEAGKRSTVISLLASVVPVIALTALAGYLIYDKASHNQQYMAEGALFVLMYAIRAVAIYTMSLSRGLDQPKLAFFPVTAVYLLGRLAGPVKAGPVIIPLAWILPLFEAALLPAYWMPDEARIAVAAAYAAVMLLASLRLFQRYSPQYTSIFMLVSVGSCGLLWAPVLFAIRKNQPLEE